MLRQYGLFTIFSIAASCPIIALRGWDPWRPDVCLRILCHSPNGYSCQHAATTSATSSFGVDILTVPRPYRAPMLRAPHPVCAQRHVCLIAADDVTSAKIVVHGLLPAAFQRIRRRCCFFRGGRWLPAHLYLLCGHVDTAASSRASMALSGKIATADVAVGQFHAGFRRIVGVCHPWCASYFGFDAAENDRSSAVVGSTITFWKRRLREHRPFYICAGIRRGLWRLCTGSRRGRSVGLSMLAASIVPVRAPRSDDCVDFVYEKDDVGDSLSIHSGMAFKAFFELRDTSFPQRLMPCQER